jgi:hypothetical protein
VKSAADATFLAKEISAHLPPPRVVNVSPDTQIAGGRGFLRTGDGGIAVGSDRPHLSLISSIIRL